MGCAFACALCACINLPDFTSESLVESPRVLAIVTDPPEVAPGGSVALSALVVGTDDYTVQYELCGTFDMLFVNAGTTNQDPTQTIGEVSTDDFMHVMVTNSLSPMRVISVLQDLVTPAGTMALVIAPARTVRRLTAAKLVLLSASTMFRVPRSWGVARPR